MGTREHKADAPTKLDIAIITASTTRKIEEDESGLWMREYAEKSGHKIVQHVVVIDQTDLITKATTDIITTFRPAIVLINGGTGISKQDITIEAVKPLFEKEMTGFGSLFAFLSFEQIGSAAILSRATAGVIEDTIVFCMPGSLKACQLACERLIFPEAGHLAKHVRIE